MLSASQLVLLLQLLGAAAAVTKFRPQDQISVYANKIGPAGNPHETYHYYTLPLCRPEKVEHKSLSLGQVIAGDRMAESAFDIKFLADREMSSLCGPRNLTQEDISLLIKAVEENYYFELFIDDLRVREKVGEVHETYVVPHVHKLQMHTSILFEIIHNNDTILYVKLRGGDLIELEHGREMVLDMKYAVHWKKSNATDRDALRLNSRLVKRLSEYHWLTIAATSIAVFFVLICIYIIIGSAIRKDFMTVGANGEDEMETGWKVIGTEVFRSPTYASLHCGAIGVGCQFIVVIVALLVGSVTGLFDVHNHGSLNTIAVVLYSLTSGIAGFISSARYTQFSMPHWVANINITSFLFSGPMMLIWAVNNSIYWAYRSTQALPWTTVVVLLSMWLLFGYPLTILGGILGRQFSRPYNAPCRSRLIPREIPAATCPYHPVMFCIVGGIVPFASVMVEMPYLFNSLWGRVNVDVSALLVVAFVIMVVLVCCNAVVLTYLQLNCEDYKWWWRSFFYGGSVGAFVFAYGVYFLLYVSRMEGFLQLCEFFTHLFLLCYIVFLAFGAVAHISSRIFVWMLYNSMKSD